MLRPGQQLIELRVARQIDRSIIADHRVKRPVGEREHLATRADIEPGARLRAEVGEVDDVADDRRRAGDLPARGVRPADCAGAGVECVEVAVVGAEVHRRPETRRVLNRGGGVDVGAGACRPRELAGLGGEGIHATVGVAHVHAAERDSGRRVELARAEPEPRAVRTDGPDLVASLRAQRVRAARVVAEVEDAIGIRDPALDSPRGVVGPQQVPISRPECAHGPALVAEVHGPSVDDRRGLGPGADRT